MGLKVMQRIEDEIFDALKNTLEEALKKCMKALVAESGSLFIFNKSREELVLKKSFSPRKLAPEGIRHRLGQGIVGFVANCQRPLLVRNIKTDARIRFRKNGFNRYRTDSFLSIPITTKYGLIGVMNITDKISGESFTEDDLKRVTLIIDCVVLATENIIGLIDADNNNSHPEMIARIDHLEGKIKQTHSEKEQLRQQVSSLEKFASVGKLASGIVHELNNPLDGIIRYVNLLLERTDSNDNLMREYLLEIKTGLNRMVNITRSLLEFSWQLNSISGSNSRYIDVERVLEETILGMQHELTRQEKKVKITRNFKGSLPQVRDKGICNAFSNILRNCFDATAAGGCISISTQIQDNHIEVKFKDTGLGIPNENITRIFEPFFTTKQKGKGTGLGLAICQEILERHKGKITVESRLGEGSTFTVIIPVGLN